MNEASPERIETKGYAVELLLDCRYFSKMAVTWSQRCALWALLSACITAYVINAYFMNEATWPCRVAAGRQVVKSNHSMDAIMRQMCVRVVAVMLLH